MKLWRGARIVWLCWLLLGCQSQQDKAALTGEDVSQTPASYTGSEGCRPCHESFYRLWSTSFHGLAMQVVTAEFLESQVVASSDPVPVGESAAFAFSMDGSDGYISEINSGGETRYKLAYALGGKNVFYFLTRLERGKLQVLPLAFDVRKRTWFDTTGSMVRHFVDRQDEALDWREQPLTFNTACYSCHVSQLSSHYDFETDTYRTSWTEPGINCETCHGSGLEHVAAASALREGEELEEVKIILTSSFSSEQVNDMCATCHAKMNPISAKFVPGERYFDHFNLRTLEDLDFYPDGRDLGENYTFTSWRMSPCLASNEFDCLTCHTSSGRNRFAGEAANEACLPCHSELVADPAGHSRHPADHESSRCVSCHMPKTEFARMVRHDHSMLPPVPQATVRFGSPNACNLCHSQETPEWAAQRVAEWYPGGGQEDYLARAELVKAARERDWSRLPEMLAYLTGSARSEVVATSLIRLLESCPDDRKWAAIETALNDPSPMVRSSAAEALGRHLNPETIALLVEACRDEYRVVRIAAASALSGLPPAAYSAGAEPVEAAIRELEASFRVRPDDWSYQYNLGNHLFNRGSFDEALVAYEKAGTLRKDAVPPLVNASMAYARLGRPGQAESSLRKALKIDPESAEVHFNLGLLLAERQDLAGSEEHLRKALQIDPGFSEAAYNLGVLVSGDRPKEALHWCGVAHRLRPADAKYAYTYAFYLQNEGRLTAAADVLQQAVQAGTADAGVFALLGAVYEKQGSSESARELYRQAAQNPAFTAAERREFSRLAGRN